MAPPCVPLGPIARARPARVTVLTPVCSQCRGHKVLPHVMIPTWPGRRGVCPVPPHPPRYSCPAPRAARPGPGQCSDMCHCHGETPHTSGEPPPFPPGCWRAAGHCRPTGGSSPRGKGPGSLLIDRQHGHCRSGGSRMQSACRRPSQGHGGAGEPSLNCAPCALRCLGRVPRNRR